MIRQIIIGFASEGNIDLRFLENIIQRSFEDVAFECRGQMEVLPVQAIPKQSGSFIDVVKSYAREAENRGVMVFCAHVDADSETDETVLVNKIIPAFEAVRQTGDVVCKNLVAIVPIQMTEAWMLADCDLLKDEIATKKSDFDLGIHKPPESYADPKQIIVDAIAIARQDFPQRRRGDVTIADLYLPMGQKLETRKLEALPSYKKFKEAVRGAFRKLNYLD